MDLQSVLILGGLGVGSFFLAKLGIRVDTKIEDKKRRALTIGRWASNNGLPLISSLMENFAINDLSGIVGKIHDISDIVGDPAQSQDVLKRFVTTQLEKQLQTLEGKQELLDFIQKRLNAVVTVTPVEHTK